MNPNFILTPEELRDRRTPGNYNFQVRYDEETGIYRDCTACIGYGEFPQTDGPKGCPQCKIQADIAFEQCNPPLSFKTDDPAQVEVFKKHFSLEAMGEAVKSPEAFAKQWSDAKAGLAKARALGGPHFVFRCNLCKGEIPVARDPGLGSFDSYRNHHPVCCGRRETTYLRKVVP